MYKTVGRFEICCAYWCYQSITMSDFWFLRVFEWQFCVPFYAFWLNYSKLTHLFACFKISSRSSFISLPRPTCMFIVFHYDIRIRVHLHLHSTLYEVIDLLVYEGQTENFEHESFAKLWGEAIPRRNFEMTGRMRKVDKTRLKMTQIGTRDRVWNTRRNDEPIPWMESQHQSESFFM
jgi:hypothetical protein